jgi:hypothetical protein
MTYTAAPQINGVTLPRPSSAPESPEAVRSTVTLAGGALRAYDAGVRFGVELSWNKMTEEDLNALRAAADPAFVAYRHVNGVTYICETTAVSADPIPGTDPARFRASISLREQDPA